MADVTVRDATPGDVPAIRRIAERGWSATYGDILARETIDAAMAKWYSPEATREFVEREDAAYLVAERDGEVVGYATGGLGDEESVATLNAIYADPEHWGEGIGTALLNRFERFCREEGYDALEIRVLSENGVGQSFYRTRAYELVEERETELFDETVGECLFRGRIE